MTEKRFKETISTGIVTDMITGKEYNCEYRINDELLELINKIAEENKELKNKLGTYKTGNALIKNTLNRYKNENQQIRDTIEEAYQNERTDLGRSVLKQLMEALP